MWSYHHQRFSVHQLSALKDNYIYLIEDHNSDMLAVVDPADAALVVQACSQLNKPLTHILNTHHHWDHTDGNKPLKSRFDSTVIAAEADAARIPGIDVGVSESSKLSLGSLNTEVISVPGHTIGHIAYLIDDALFCGDTLFGGGCGRLFEGSMEQMWNSLTKLASLPEEIKVYCAHEYTLSNLRFARTIDPENSALKARISSDTQKRMKQLPTIPSTIALEKQTNPFLRPLNSHFCSDYAKTHQLECRPAVVFRDLRERRNQT